MIVDIIKRLNSYRVDDRNLAIKDAVSLERMFKEC